MAKTRVENRLGQIRKSRGVAVSDLARRAGVSRQTIHAIEAGTYVPNTEVALHLARELEVQVDALFCLAGSPARPPRALASRYLGASPPAKSQAVRVCRIGSQWVGAPVSAAPYYMPEADGIVQRASRTGGRTRLLVFAAEEVSAKRLLLAGCDPATGWLSHMVERTGGVEMVPAAASSRQALTWLKQGTVHIAGTHLEDPRTGEFNLPYIRDLFPGEKLAVVTFARWEEGFVVAPGNPKGVRSPGTWRGAASGS